MTAKEYLKQAGKLEQLVDAKKEQILRIKDQLEGTGINLSPDKVSRSSGRPDKMAELVASLNTLQDLYVADIVRLLRLKYGISVLIDKVPTMEQRLILFDRYVNMKDIQDICRDNYMSWSTVKRLHAKGLFEIDKIINVTEPLQKGQKNELL